MATNPSTGGSSSSVFDNKKKGQEFVKEQVDTHSKAILTVTQRQKDIEGSLDLLSEKLDLLDHNSIRNFRKANDEVKDAHNEIKELKAEIETLKEFNSKMAKQIKLMSTRDEVTKLEKYIDFWEPMNFVTRDEIAELRQKIKGDLEEIIEKVLEE